jgi:uncharacterized protein
MKLSLETSSANIIHSYAAGSVQIQQNSVQSEPSPNNKPGQVELVTITGHLIITPELIIEDWLDDAPNIGVEDIERVVATQPEVILLGTGKSLSFPDNKVLQLCSEKKIGIEVMDTAAACRTYNILASEYRKVAAALLMI